MTKNLVRASTAYCQSEGIDIRFCIIGAEASEFENIAAGLGDLNNVLWIDAKVVEEKDRRS